MKMAKLYFNRRDLALKFGVNAEDFIIGQAKTEYDSVEFDIIFINDVEVKGIEVVETVDTTFHLRRQKL